MTTENFAPVIDAVAESGCDLLFLCSYLAESIGLGRTIRAHPFRPKMVGGAMRLANSAMGRGKSWCHRQTSSPERFVFLMPTLSLPSRSCEVRQTGMAMGEVCPFIPLHEP